MKSILLKSLTVICSLLIIVSFSSFLPQSVKAADPVCVIVETGVEYDDLASAIADVATDGTIRLLNDIKHTSNVVINKTVTFDVNGFTLSVDTKSGHALEVGAGGEVKLINNIAGGKFDVNTNGTGNGVYVHDGGKAEVTNAYKGNINNIDQRAAYVTGADSTLVVRGNVNGGFYGLSAFAGAKVTIYGNLTGGGAMTVSGTGTIVTVYGYTNGGGTGVFATDNAVVYVKGNVYGGGIGVYVSTGAQVTVDGYVRAYDGSQIYVRFDSTNTNKMQPDFEAVSSKVGYYEYNDGISYLWVKKFDPPIKISVTYIYEGTTEYSDQNDTNTAATLITSGNYGATLTAAPDPSPSRTDYKFIGWFTDPTNGIEWSFGSSGTLLTSENSVNITQKTLTLYARWAENEVIPPTEEEVIPPAETDEEPSPNTGDNAPVANLVIVSGFMIFLLIYMNKYRLRHALEK